MSERGASARGASALGVALIAGLGSGLATVVALRLLDPAPERTEPLGRTERDADALAPLQQELAALRLEFASLRLPVVDGASTTPTAASLGPGAPATQADVVAVAEAVRRLEGRLDASLPVEIPPSTPADAVKREALWAFLDKKKPAPPADYLYFTESRLLAAYGPPTFITTREGGHAWNYVVGTSEAGELRVVRFVFAGGRVANLEIQ